MTQSPAALGTARRNLVHRVGRFIEQIGNGLQPNVDAMANLEIAVECLEREDHPAGEDAMLLAEKGWAPRFPQTTDPRPIGELVETFGRLCAQEIR